MTKIKGSIRVEGEGSVQVSGLDVEGDIVVVTKSASVGMTVVMWICVAVVWCGVALLALVSRCA